MELKASPLGSTPTCRATSSCPYSSIAIPKVNGFDIDVGLSQFRYVCGDFTVVQRVIAFVQVLNNDLQLVFRHSTRARLSNARARTAVRRLGSGTTDSSSGFERGIAAARIAVATPTIPTSLSEMIRGATLTSISKRAYTQIISTRE